MTARILVTGGTGTLARALETEVCLPATYASRHDCDIRNWGQLYGTVRDLEPEVIIHAAALTDHQHPDPAEVIETNIIGSSNVAKVAKAVGARLVYLSTHYVYAGETGNYREIDVPRPIGTYAWSKYAGERSVESVPDLLIIRGSWYNNIMRVQKWLRQGALVDAYCGREHVSDAARKVAALVRANLSGIINIGGPRRTFYEIARESLPDGMYVPRITRAQLDAIHRVKGPAYEFPADSSVNVDKFNSLNLSW
jgi:dTDP-4-dehydrorhamnose reductase